MLGTNHPSTATSYNNLAVLNCKLGEYEKALDVGLRAYKVNINILGLDHSDTQRTYKNMEIIYSKWNPKGNFEQWLEEQMKG